VCHAPAVTGVGSAQDLLLQSFAHRDSGSSSVLNHVLVAEAAVSGVRKEILEADRPRAR
jgi:hypothetical protein